MLGVSFLGDVGANLGKHSRFHCLLISLDRFIAKELFSNGISRDDRIG